MVTRNVIHRIFYIRNIVNAESGLTYLGTAFTFETENRQYLATAKHSFPYTEHAQELDFAIMVNNDWRSIHSRIFFHANKNVDIAILSLPNDLSPRTTLTLSAEGIILGQDTFFLGFPYGKYMNANINNGYPLPFIKKGTLSSITVSKDGVHRIYLDGMNNPGFSGGPCVFTRHGEELSTIYGLIKGYVPHTIQVKTPFGDYNFEENSGLVEVHSISHLNEIRLH